MPFFQKWLLTSGVTFVIIFALSCFYVIYRNISLHPSSLDYNGIYQRRRRRNFPIVVAIFFIVSILLGVIAAGIWEGYNYYFIAGAVYGPLLCLANISFISLDL
jgi:hypothetical protein